MDLDLDSQCKNPRIKKTTHFIHTNNYNFGKFINQFQTEIEKLVRKLERILIKL